MRISYCAALAAAIVASPSFASGFHADAHLGYDRLTSNGNHDSGVIYGGALGYDFTVAHNLFVGVEGNIDGSSIKECASASGTTACLKLGRDLSLVARAGVKFDGSKLYGLAGYTNARIEATLTTPTTSASGSTDEGGYRLGVGYEFPLAKQVYGKVEYRYSHYKDDDANVSFNRHNVLAGIGLNF